MLRDLRGPAGGHERGDRGDLPVPQRESRPRVDVAVRELHDRVAEVAEALDRGQRLLVVHLEEPLSPSLVPVVRHRAPSIRRFDVRGPAGPRARG